MSIQSNQTPINTNAMVTIAPTLIGDVGNRECVICTCAHESLFAHPDLLPVYPGHPGKEQLKNRDIAKVNPEIDPAAIDLAKPKYTPKYTHGVCLECLTFWRDTYTDQNSESNTLPCPQCRTEIATINGKTIEAIKIEENERKRWEDEWNEWLNAIARHNQNEREEEERERQRQFEAERPQRKAAMERALLPLLSPPNFFTREQIVQNEHYKRAFQYRSFQIAFAVDIISSYRFCPESTIKVIQVMDDLVVACPRQNDEQQMEVLQRLSGGELEVIIRWLADGGYDHDITGISQDAREGGYRIIEKMLPHRTEVDLTYFNNLSNAIETGQYELVKMLIKHPSYSRSYQEYINLASDLDQKEIALLLFQGESSSDGAFNRAFLEAAKNDNDTLLKDVLEIFPEKIDFILLDQALIEAASKGNTKTIELLLSHEASRQKISQGAINQALNVAAVNQNQAIVSILSKTGMVSPASYFQGILKAATVGQFGLAAKFAQNAMVSSVMFGLTSDNLLNGLHRKN